jgi:hypothetical protein
MTDDMSKQAISGRVFVELHLGASTSEEFLHMHVELRDTQIQDHLQADLIEL